MSPLHQCLVLMTLFVPQDVEDGSESGTDRVTDADLIQGIWLGSELVDDERYSLTFTPGRFEANAAGDRSQFTWSIDQTTSPRRITFISTDEDQDVYRGIYELNGSRLVVCVPEDPSGPRPTRFELQDGVTLMRLHRPEDSPHEGAK